MAGLAKVADVAARGRGEFTYISISSIPSSVTQLIFNDIHGPTIPGAAGIGEGLFRSFAYSLSIVPFFCVWLWVISLSHG